MSVTPKGTQVADAAAWALTYTVKNTGTVAETYNLFCPAQISCDSVRGPDVSINSDGSWTINNFRPGQSTPVTAYFRRFTQCYYKMPLDAQGPFPGNQASDEGYYQKNPCFVSSVSGPRQLQPGNTCNYTASASGGTPPYTFTWSWTTDGSASVGGYSPSNGNFILAGQGGQGNVYLTATATDANGLAASGSETIWLNPNISC